MRCYVLVPAAISSMQLAAASPPSGMHTASRLQPSLPAGPGPASPCLWLCCNGLLECCLTLLGRVPQIPPALHDTARTLPGPLLLRPATFFRSSPRCQTERDLWVAGLCVLQHLPCLSNHELLSESVTWEFQLVFLTIDGNAAQALWQPQPPAEVTADLPLQSRDCGHREFIHHNGHRILGRIP